MSNHNQMHEIANSFSKEIPNLDALLIVNPNGRIIESRVNQFFEKQHDIDWLKNFAMIVSVRFPLSDFHKKLGGLKMTINVFNDKAVVVKKTEDENMIIVIVPRNEKSIRDAIFVISDEKDQLCGTKK
jgi:hypothetical protein